MTPWSYEKTLTDKNPNVDTLNLNFATNIGDISIMTLQVGSGAVLIHVQGNGSYSYLTKTEQPMSSTFDNQTVGNTLTVNSKVTVENAFTSGAVVAIQIYVDPSVKLNLNVTSITGKITLTGDRDTTFQSLFLQSTTGTVETNLQDTITLTGPVSLKTTTGAVSFRMHEIDVVGNSSINLQATTGDVGMDITETTQLHGNVAVNVHTTTGTIYVGLEVDAGVSAKITSTTNLGQIKTDLTSFNGNKSPLTSSNYPSASNIEITNTVTGTGDISITAKCQTTTNAS
jgi:predicted membrane protein